ncbi:MAG: hypothetical protein ABR562_01365 [Thermoplasmatota archaeon]
MRSLRPALALMLVAVACAPALDGQAGCNSVGVTPIAMAVADAQPGQSYVRSVTVQNPCPYGRDIAIAAEGEAGPWMSTSPSGSFHLGPADQRSVQVTIQVPALAGPGGREALLRFTGAATQDESGNSQVAVAAAVPLNVTVGGTAVVRLGWTEADASDVESLNPPVGHANATNTGNVAATARMAATVTALDGTAVLARGNGSLTLKAGDSGRFTVYFTDKLPVGQYVMHFQSTVPQGFAADRPFKVTVPGEHPPSGTLLAIQHAPYGTAGLPLRIDGTFRNDGNVAIRAAQLKAEVKQGGELLAALESPVLAVPVGATVNLTAYWTPPAAGTYDLAGHVVYDGYVTPDSTSPVNAKAAAGLGFPWWILLVAGLVVVGGLAAWLLAGRRRDGPKPGRRPDARQPWQRRK